MIYLMMKINLKQTASRKEKSVEFFLLKKSRLIL